MYTVKNRIMKTRFVILFIFSGIFIAKAHDLRYDKIVLRNWKVENSNQSFEASFLKLQDGEVYVEDLSNSIHKLAFSSLSKSDQDFVKSRDAFIKKINLRNGNLGSGEHRFQSSPENTFVWVILILFGIGATIIWTKLNLNTIQWTFLLGLASMFMFFSFRASTTMYLPVPSSPASLDSAFAPFKPNVHTFWDSKYFYVESKGIPTTHNMMVGISDHGWQQQVPIPQCYIGQNSWPIPLFPVPSSDPIPVDSIHFTRGAIAIAANGVPIFNVHTNTGVDSYLDGQLDQFGGHCGRADDYHYHIAPLHLYSYTPTSLPIAYGLDGYPIYGSVEPDGSQMKNLDANHGHFDSNGLYHYHGTATAPYMIARMAGQVTEDATHQLIPQAAAKPVRPSLTPLRGALITSCILNKNKNGYDLEYNLNNQKHVVSYNWSPTGVYTFYFISATDTVKSVYNGFIQCSVPVTGTLDAESEHSEVFSIQPNPAKDRLVLKLREPIVQEDVRGIKIYDLQGKVLREYHGFMDELQIENINPGVYLLVAELKSGRSKQMFVKL